MKKFLLALVLAWPCFAQISNLQVVGTASTQVILRYQTGFSGVCTIAGVDAFDNSTPVDINATLFASSNQDISRDTSVVDGTSRTIVIGKRSGEKASNGRVYSRALATENHYSFTVTCNGQSASIQANTQTIPVGDSSPHPVPYSEDGDGHYPWPDLNYSDKTESYIDPVSGIRTKLMTGPNELYNVMGESSAAVRVFDQSAGSWSNIAGVQGTSTYASITGNGAQSKSLFLVANIANRGPTRPIYDDNYYFYNTDVQFKINGYGSASSADDRTVNVCITVDGGASCLGDTTRSLVLPTSAGDVAFPNVDPSTTRLNAYFAEWGSPKLRQEHMYNRWAMHASVSGSNVTVTRSDMSSGYMDYNNNEIAGGNTKARINIPVNALAPGMKVVIAGSHPTCPNNVCTVASIKGDKSMTIAENLGSWSSAVATTSSAIAIGATSFTVGNLAKVVQNPQSFAWSFTIGDGAQAEGIYCYALSGNTLSQCNPAAKAHVSGESMYQDLMFFPNFGYLVWKKTNTGTINIRNARNTWLDSTSHFHGYGGGNYWCGTEFATSTAKDGVTPLANPIKGAICSFPARFGQLNSYFVETDTGNTRTLSSNAGLGGTFTTNNLTSNPGINRQVYNDPTFKEYMPWTGNLSEAQSAPNPAILETEILIPGIRSMIETENPQIDFEYFTEWRIEGAAGYPKFNAGSWTVQDGISWFCQIDMSKPDGQKTQCDPSWNFGDLRWSGFHGLPGVNYPGWISMTNPTTLKDEWTKGKSPYDITITSVDESGFSDSRLPYIFTRSCSALGVINLTSIIPNGDDDSCIKVRALSQPISRNVSSVDLGNAGTGNRFLGFKPIAWKHNATNCANGAGDGVNAYGVQICAAYLQDLKVGDQLFDPAFADTYETFKVLKVDNAANNSLDIVLYRSLNIHRWFEGASGPHTHGAGQASWKLRMQPTGQGGQGYEYPWFFKQGLPLASNGVLSEYQNAHNIMQYDNGNHVAIIAGGGNTPHLCDGPGYSAGYFGYSAYSRFTGSTLEEMAAAQKADTIGTLSPFNNFCPGLGVSTNAMSQYHPGGTQYAAIENEGQWFTDGKSVAGAFGNGAKVGYQKLTAVAGQSHTWKIGPMIEDPGQRIIGSGANPGLQGVAIATGPNESQYNTTKTIAQTKTRAWMGWAGRQLLKDVSSSATASTGSPLINDSMPFAYCVALQANECVNGSVKGDTYVSVYGARIESPYSAQNNSADTYSLCTIFTPWSNTPCLAPMGSSAGQLVQIATRKVNRVGERTRNLGMGFNGPSREPNYYALTTDTIGKWAFTTCYWCGGGYGMELLGFKLPGWPAEDSVNRMRSTPLSVSVSGSSGDQVRVLFGTDKNLYCLSRNEPCSTGTNSAGDKWVWPSESTSDGSVNTWKNCDTGCTIDVPVVQANTAVYYQVQRRNSANPASVKSSPIQVVAAP